MINDALQFEIAATEQRLRTNHQSLLTAQNIDDYFNTRLYSSVDGAGLREAANVKEAHRWIREPTTLLSGRDFVNCIRLRINALPVRARTTRGRPQMDRRCRGGCLTSETAYHVIQACHRSHHSRIARHNSVISYMKRKLTSQGYVVYEEPRLNTTEGVRKPDLVAVRENAATVLDAQVISDADNLDNGHSRKRAYYNTSAVKTAINESFQAEVRHVSSITLSWRGIWSKASANELMALSIIGKSDMALLSTRAAIGSLICFRTFNNTTTVRREGIG